ncbi:DUF116 domain-containing protein [candidate division KSB1 bacterium]
MEEKTDQKRDRVLGDEWLDWDGKKMIENPDSQKSLFFIFAGLLLILYISAGLLVIYMISPRLEQFYPVLPLVCYIGHGLFSLYSVFTYTVIALALLTEKSIWIKLKKKNFLYNSFVPMVIKIADYFGIPRDRISNSFIKVNNAIVKATLRKIMGENAPERKVLILLPRCLQKEALKDVMGLKKTYNIDIHTVPGGTQARAIIQKTRPRAVIGVACERDLLTGIKDVATKIPVIGVVNQRPKGPCKETLIDIAEIEKAIRLFTDSPES